MSDAQRAERVDIDEIYKDDIDKYIHLWMDDRNITDMCKVSQNRWYNCCQYVCEHVFKVNPVYLMQDNALNYYDSKKVNDILDLYVNLCNDYEKVINIVGFTFFTGIHRDTLNDWSHKALSSEHSDICKKIDEMREESLVGLQTSGKNNPMCYMPSLNKYCGFNMPGVRDQTSARRVATAAELPRLDGSNCAGLPDNFDNSRPNSSEIVIDNSNNLSPSI